MRGFWLQFRVVTVMCLLGMLVSVALMSAGVSSRSVSDASLAPQKLSRSAIAKASDTVSGGQEKSWHYYLINNGLTALLPIGFFYLNLFILRPFDKEVVPGPLTGLLYRFVGWYLQILGLKLNSSTAFLHMAMALSFVSVAALGVMAFLFGLIIPAAIKLTGALFFFGAILPHGIFEIPAAIASGAIPLAVFAEIVRRRREDEMADSGLIAREIGLSRSMFAAIACLVVCVIVAAVIESQYTGMFVENYLIPKFGMGGELGVEGYQI